MKSKKVFAPILGDLSVLSEEQKKAYVLDVCDFLGVPPELGLIGLTLMDIGDGGRQLTLYVKRGATDIIRDRRKISVTKLETANGDGYVGWMATGTDSSGRQEIAVGAVTTKGLNGRAIADAVKTSQTQALRRMTLQFAGGGFLDETEIHEKTTNILNSAEGLELLPTSAPSNLSLIQEKEGVSKVEQSSLPMVEPQPSLTEGKVTVDAASPVTAAQPEEIKKRQGRPKKVVSLDSPVVSVAEVVPERPVEIPIPVGAQEARPEKQALPESDLMPTKEQEEVFRDRLSKYVNEILPPGGFVQTEKLGTRNAQMKAFVKVLFPGANLKSLSVYQWNYLLTFLDEGATNVGELVSEIYTRLGV